MSYTSPIIVVGSINTDLQLEVPQLPRPGQTIMATTANTTSGGKGANQAVAAAASGAEVHLVAAIGDDQAGQARRDGLRERAVRVDHIAEVPGPTGQAVVAVAPDGENLILVVPGANAQLDPRHVSDVIRQIRPAVLLCQLEVPKHTVKIALQTAPDAIRILNPAPAPSHPGELRDLLPHTDILVPNRSELAALSGHTPPHTLPEVDAAVADLGFEGDVIVTLGADGARIYPRADHTLPIHISASQQVHPIDTSGAGDVLCGILASALVQGHPLPEATRLAVAVASASTEHPGAQLAPQLAASVTRSRHD